MLMTAPFKNFVVQLFWNQASNRHGYYMFFANISSFPRNFKLYYPILKLGYFRFDQIWILWSNP